MFIRSKAFYMFHTFRNTILIQTKNSTLLTAKNNHCVARLYCDQIKHNNSKDPPETKTDIKNENSVKSEQAVFDSKYVIFQDSEAPVVLDVYEETMQLETETLLNVEDKDEFYGLNLKRGVHGVFDIEDLLEVLRRDKAQDIFVASLPPAANYVDYIVIVSGRSRKHMNALADIVRRVFKKKRSQTDIIPHIEGEGSNTWMAMDLGNIALHIFSHDARQVYDLESLWSLGPEFDPIVNKPEDEVIALLKKHAYSFEEMSSKKLL